MNIFLCQACIMCFWKWLGLSETFWKHFYQITYLVAPIESIFRKQNQQQFRFTLKKGKFSATHWVLWISQKLQLWVVIFLSSCSLSSRMRLSADPPFSKTASVPNWSFFPKPIQYIPSLTAHWHWFSSPVLHFLHFLMVFNDWDLSWAFVQKLLSLSKTSSNLALSRDVLIWGECPFLFNGMTFHQTWRLFWTSFLRNSDN